MKLTRVETNGLVKELIRICNVESMTVTTINISIKLSEIYHFSHWDGLIVASASLSGASILYTEDMQHMQLIENQLRIINPFIVDV